ncbi:NADH-ubiquinone oxidoreductase [Naegleria gruberi]|uniref:NADH-ubiquinone oxidoreductase n=1 Tax=Naegleria gruberi TaxID=5762 RepID=D2VT73_NAEGR|nr:NADH-ubiquinone oxidoreductase [Naegleria gruberi]EFC40034.1 NADH-ubiquinone oxidoreductase [Naegleria gruberi]|eukprot:XP_002672778.1 NADH-ubiquinone oxidoreductase [Naegleria gruberi strain NEG-M]
MFKKASSSSIIQLNKAVSTKSSPLVANLSSIQSANFTDYAYIRSKSLEEANANVLFLYRRMLKILPWMKETYHVPTNLDVMRKTIHKEFKSFQGLSDTELIDALVIRGYIEYNEATMHHKQRGHIIKFFIESDVTNVAPHLQEYKRIMKEKVDTQSLCASVEGKGMGRNIGKYLKNTKDL